MLQPYPLAEWLLKRPNRTKDTNLHARLHEWEKDGLDELVAALNLTQGEIVATGCVLIYSLLGTGIPLHLFSKTRDKVIWAQMREKAVSLTRTENLATETFGKALFEKLFRQLGEPESSGKK